MPDPKKRMEQLEKRTFEADIKEGSTVKKTQDRGNRSNLELVYCFLKACEAGGTKTRILYRANINIKQWNKLEFLLDDGYAREEIHGDSRIFALEERGRELIEIIDTLREFTDYNPRIISDENIKLREIPQKTPTQKSVPHDAYSERQKPVSYDVYHDKLSTILGELNQTDSKIIKKALITLGRYTPIAGCYNIQVNPNLSVILKRGKSPNIQILLKDPDSISHSIVYSSSDSSPEIWNDMSKETKEDTIKTLQELGDRSRLIISEKYVEVKTVKPESVTKLEDTSRQVAPSKLVSEVSYNERRTLNGAENFLNTKMSRLKHYGEDDVERLLTLFIKEELKNTSLHSDSPSGLFDSLLNARILIRYCSGHTECYKLRENPQS